MTCELLIGPATSNWGRSPGRTVDIERDNMDNSALYVLNPTNVTWRKSKRSFVEGDECVEVAELGGGAVALRDSKNPTGSHLRFTASEWGVFLNGVRHGEF